MKKMRARFDKNADVHKYMEKLQKDSPESFQDYKKCSNLVKLHFNRPIHGLLLGKIHRELLGVNGSATNSNLFEQIGIVSKTAKRVGGLSVLKGIISILEKAKEL